MCLKADGVTEEGENTDDIIVNLINDELGIGDMEKSDIARSYRIGQRKEGHRATRSSSSK